MRNNNPYYNQHPGTRAYSENDRLSSHTGQGQTKKGQIFGVKFLVGLSLDGKETRLWLGYEIHFAKLITRWQIGSHLNRNAIHNDQPNFVIDQPKI